MNTTYHTYLNSPVGPLYIESDGQFVTGIFMQHHKHWDGPSAASQKSDEPFTAVQKQLAEYFAGERTEFDVPIRLAGTAFQQRVWQELTKIPFGKTISYVELAKRVGQPNAFGAVGNANGKNPVSIIVPCHRVIGANGSLTGYGGGLHNKEWLLDWERRDQRSFDFDSARSPIAAGSM